MKNAILIHGMPSQQEYLKPGNLSPSNNHWFPWLQHQLNIRGVLTQTPEMPTPYEPDYEKWKLVFEQFHLDENTVLVGHSCGGGFLVRWLSENNKKINKLVLVAPWIDPNGGRAEKMFHDLTIRDFSDQVQTVGLFISTEDDQEELDTAAVLKNSIKNLEVKEFFDKGHFTFGDMKTVEFPELLNYILG